MLHSFADPRFVVRSLLARAANPRLGTQDVVMLPPAEPFAGHDLARTLSEETGRLIRLTPFGSGMIRAASLFSRAAREQAEMLYQVNRDYTIDDALFRTEEPHFPRVWVNDLTHSWAQAGVCVARRD